ARPDRAIIVINASSRAAREITRARKIDSAACSLPFDNPESPGNSSRSVDADRPERGRRETVRTAYKHGLLQRSDAPHPHKSGNNRAAFLRAAKNPIPQLHGRRQ